MKFKILPNPDKIAEYQCIIQNCKSEEQIQCAISENHLITKIYVNFSAQVLPDYNNHSFKNSKGKDVEVLIVSQDDIAKLMNSVLTIPKWIQYESNYQRLRTGDFDDIRPITAELITTLNCNYRCEQCSYAEPKKERNLWINKETNCFSYDYKRTDNHMDEATMRAAIDSLVSGGVRNILFTGGGEPFVNPKITISGMRYAKEKGLRIGLYTNGSLLNPGIISSIMDISPLFVRVSVYGSNSAVFSKYTKQKPQLYDTVLANIKLLAMSKLKLNASTTLGLSYLVHPITIIDLDGFPDTLNNAFTKEELSAIDFCRFTPSVDYFGGQQHSQDEMKLAFTLINKIIVPTLKTYGIEAKPYYHRLNDLHKSKPYKNCLASGWYVEVGPNADLYLCCEKLFIPSYKIGNLTKMSLDDIFNGNDRKNVLEYVNANLCKDCPPLCKPHELNKLFNRIEGMRAKGEFHYFEKWKSDLMQLGQEVSHFAGKLNDFES